MRLLLPPLHARTRTTSSPRHLSSEALAEDLEGGEGRIGLSGYGVAVPRRFARDDAGLVEHLAAHSSFGASRVRQLLAGTQKLILLFQNENSRRKNLISFTESLGEKCDESTGEKQTRNNVQERHLRSLRRGGFGLCAPPRRGCRAAHQRCFQ